MNLVCPQCGKSDDLWRRWTGTVPGTAILEPVIVDGQRHANEGNIEWDFDDVDTSNPEYVTCECGWEYDGADWLRELAIEASTEDASTEDAPSEDKMSDESRDALERAHQNCYEARAYMVHLLDISGIAAEYGLIGNVMVSIANMVPSHRLDALDAIAVANNPNDLVFDNAIHRIEKARAAIGRMDWSDRATVGLADVYVQLDTICQRVFASHKLWRIEEKPASVDLPSKCKKCNDWHRPKEPCS